MRAPLGVVALDSMKVRLGVAVLANTKALRGLAAWDSIEVPTGKSRI
jgi:hypothetical protein